MARPKSLIQASGLIVVIVGVAGVGLSAYLAYHALATADRLREEAPEVFEHLENVAVAVQGHGETAAGALRVTRERLSSIDDVIDELSHETEDGKVRSVLELVDTDIWERLRGVESFVRLLQSNLQSMSGTILLLESLFFIKPRQTEGTENSELRQMASSLTEVSEALDQVTFTLADVRSRQVLSPRQLAVLQSAMSEIDRHLAQAQTDIEQLADQLKQLAKQLTRAKRQSRPWIATACTLVLIFSVCFAFSQGALALRGWRSVRGR